MEMIPAILTKIRDLLLASADLSDIAAFVLGELPSPYPEQWFPLCQIIVVPEEELSGSISHDEQRYTGQIAFWLHQSTLAYQDYSRLTDNANKTVSVPSYERETAWVEAARDVLRSPTNYTLGDLQSTSGELVCAFWLGERAHGAGAGERANTWENVGRIQFFVQTERRKPAATATTTTYVATVLTGVYSTPTALTVGATPVWTARNTGLASTQIRVLTQTGDGNLWCLTTARSAYSLTQSTQTWVERLTQATVRATLGQPTAELAWIAGDAASDDIYALVGVPFSASLVYLFRSTDGGQSWTYSAVGPSSGATLYETNNLAVRSPIIALGVSRAGGVKHYIRHSLDGGLTWTESPSLGEGAGVPSWVILSPHSSLVYTRGDAAAGASIIDLLSVTAAGVVTELQAALNIGPEMPDSMTLSTVTAGAQRVVKSSKIYETTDGWATVLSASPATLTPTVHTLFETAGGVLICGRRGSLTVGAPHVLMAYNAGTLVGLAGADPTNTGTTASIPYNCGGLAYGGIQAVTQ